VNSGGRSVPNWNGQQESASGRLIDYVGGTNPVYIGKAYPGTATSDPFWQICKLTFDVNNNPTSIQYAGGSWGYDFVWDNRAILSYL
jgi:hypothetical protein